VVIIRRKVNFILGDYRIENFMLWGEHPSSSLCAGILSTERIASVQERRESIKAYEKTSGDPADKKQSLYSIAKQ